MAMKFSNEARGFKVRSYNEAGPEPVFQQHFKIENRATTIFIRINDFKGDGYISFTKVSKSGKTVRISFNAEEMFNLFDLGNSKKFKEGMEKCLEKITNEFGILPGSQREDITYENIPKSVRALEMQKNAKMSKERQEYLEAQIDRANKEYDMIQEEKRKHQASAARVNKRKQSQPKKIVKKRKVVPPVMSEEDEEEEEEVKEEDEEEEEEEEDEEET